MSAAFSDARVTTKEASAGESKRSSNDVLQTMLAKLSAYQPESKMANLDYVREMFDPLEEKLKADASYAELATLLKNPDFNVKDSTLKTMMSKIRRERKVIRIKCPCCQSMVPESEIGEQYCNGVPSEVGVTGESAA